MYRHTQTGPLLLWITLSASIFGLLALVIAADEPPLAVRLAVGAALLVLGFVGLTFRALTVFVENGVLGWYFGPGVLRRNVPLGEVEHVEATRTTFLAGWGIHWTPRGWLYNVSGFDAVWVHLRGGKRFLLGTDEPARLVQAIGAGREAAPR